MNKRINDHDSLRIRYLYLDRNILQYELQTKIYKIEQNICKRINFIKKKYYSDNYYNQTI